MRFVKKKQFQQVHITATYDLLDGGGVRLKETWTYPDGSFREYIEDEVWKSSDPKAVAQNHDWDLYIETAFPYV